MRRKDFLQLTALGLGAFVMPGMQAFGRDVSPDELLADGMDVSKKKQLADVAQCYTDFPTAS